MRHSARILLVDEDRAFLREIAGELQTRGYETKAVTSAGQALAALPVFQPALVITALGMTGTEGMALFERMRGEYPALPVIITAAHGSIADAIEATQKGAFNYLTKPFEGNELLASIERALALQNGSASALAAGGQWPRDIITRNHAMQALLAQARRAAASDVGIVIQSESGTGKELLARAIHDASQRADGVFLALNCSAVPEALLESELFGHAKGAFTGATREYQGLFQAAAGGTLFLDEIGDMPLDFQAKLLRAIQEKAVRPVGSTRGVSTDVRILAATHHNLAKEVSRHNFREDLFYRLDVIQLEIPPLRDRPEDIPLLANYFLKQFSNNQGGKRRHFSPKAMELLMGGAWPGNVRQLRNTVEQTAVLSPTALISANQVRQALRGEESEMQSLAEARKRFERRYLVQVLQITEGNVSRAAKLAQRNRTEFYKLLNRHHIELDQFRGGASRSDGLRR
jgi:two-component system response regulator GlrR